MSLPNILTLVRLAISMIVVAFAHFDYLILSLLFYILGVITDFADGKIARKFSLSSAFGRSMDSTADKVLVLSVLVVFVVRDLISVYWLYLFVCREFFIFGLRAIKTNGNSLASINDFLGRFRFFILHCGLLIIFLNIIIFNQIEILHTIGTILVISSVTISYIVVLHYVGKDWERIKRSMRP